MKIDAVKKVGNAVVLLLSMMPVVALLSCEGTAPTASDLDEIVVQAYLFAGQPVNSVRVKYMGKTIIRKDERLVVWPKDGGGEKPDTVDTTIYKVYERYINDAAVTITNNGVPYELVSVDSGWYHETAGNLVVTMGQTYRIDITAGGKHAWAETTVPQLLGGFVLSRDTLYLTDPPPDTCGKEGCKEIPGEDKGAVTGEAAPPMDSLSYLIMKWNSSSRDGIYYHYEYDGGSGGGLVEADSLRLVAMIMGDGLDYVHMGDFGLIIPQTGRYSFKCYMVTPEFVQMTRGYMGSIDSTRQDLWTGSPTNVHGGVGFFTSFALDSVSFQVVPR